MVGEGRKRRGSWKKNAAQQTKIQIYFDFFFINRKINFARSAHSNTHTKASTHIQEQAEQQQKRQQRECDAAGACSLTYVLRSHALSRALLDCLAPCCLPHSPDLWVCVSEYKCVRVCVSIISKRLTLCYCAALLCCENNWIKFKCFCCIICCAYYCYLFKLAITTTTATTKVTHTRVLKAVNKTKAAQQQLQKQEHKQQESEGETESTYCVCGSPGSQTLCQPSSSLATPLAPVACMFTNWRCKLNL